MPLRYRRARVADFARCWHLLAPDRPLFQEDTWKKLPQLMADLLERETLLLSVVEDIASGHPVMFGASAFVQAGLMRHILAHPHHSGVDHLFRSEIDGRQQLVSPRQVAVANAGSTLELFTFFGVPENIASGDPAALATQVYALEAWTFFHRGFQVANIWQEYSQDAGCQAMKNLGFTGVREARMSDGSTARLHRMTRAEMRSKFGLWTAASMETPFPVFGFSRPEQKLLEYSLLDYSDRDFATEFDLTPDAVKKRWRSIYAKIEAREPALLAAAKGADRRRLVLQSVRQSLQELRPYRLPKNRSNRLPT